MLPYWFVIVFLFAIGACVGSFLNVVIYRLPAEKSLVKPGSHCPRCNSPIAFYDNIPIISWLLLRAKCRNCKAPISPRYFVIELLTALLFVLLYYFYFVLRLRNGLGMFENGGWFFYLAHIVLIASLLACSAIDLEHWIIPLSICWFITIFGIVCSVLSGFFLDWQGQIICYELFPAASARTAAWAVGGTAGLLVSNLLLMLGLLKRSYIMVKDVQINYETSSQDQMDIKHRVEMLREILFLLPVLTGIFIGELFWHKSWWIDFAGIGIISRIAGSLAGYLAGCGIVWLTRILGTLAFNKEAMGLGDVHLMGAAGTVIGAYWVVVAFFVAPFFGLIWAIFQTFYHKIRQIPYGPFLSAAVIVVMILRDIIRQWLPILPF